MLGDRDLIAHHQVSAGHLSGPNFALPTRDEPAHSGAEATMPQEREIE